MLKFVFALFSVFIVGSAYAQIIVADNIKVSVTDKSAAIAREKALDQAHVLAFEKLMKDNFPDYQNTQVPHDAILGMVLGFSIEREKSTSKNYTALLSFQFDGSKVTSWLQNQSSDEEVKKTASSQKGQLLQLFVTYDSLNEWTKIKNVLETSPQVNHIKYLTISPKEAEVSVVCSGSQDQLRKSFDMKGISVSPKDGKWEVSYKPPTQLGK